MIETILPLVIDRVKKTAGAGLEVVKAQNGARQDNAQNTQNEQMFNIGKSIRGIGNKLYDKLSENKDLEAVANATTTTA